MALADREYFRYDQPRRRGGSQFMGELFATAPVTAWLIVINVAVYLLDVLLPQYIVTFPDGHITQQTGLLKLWGHFSAATTVFGFQFWRLLTFQFLHGDLTHLLFNMIALYFFGPMVESYLGSARYLRYYLISGVGGAVMYLVLFTTGVLGGTSAGWWWMPQAWAPLVGASAGIFGVLVCAALVAPDTTIMLLFPPVPMRLRTMAWVFIVIAVYTVLTRGRNAGGEAAHLGGAIVGYALLQGQRLFDGRTAARRDVFDDPH